MDPGSSRNVLPKSPVGQALTDTHHQ